MRKNLLVVLVILTSIPFSLLFYRNLRVQNSAFQKAFVTGTFPSPLPDGFYKGSVQALNTSWKGKDFDASSSTGINIVGEKRVYPFKTYKGKGLQDKNLDVLKIDYNIPQNPFWLRFILDEIVQTASGKYLGKVHLNFIPGLSFSLGFFRLER